MEEAGDRDRLVLSHQAAIGGHAALGAALAVLHGELGLAAVEDTAHRAVDVLDRKFGAAPDQLAGGRVAGRREWDLQPDHHRIGGVHGSSGKQQRERAHDQSEHRHRSLPSHKTLYPVH